LKHCPAANGEQISGPIDVQREKSLKAKSRLQGDCLSTSQPMFS